MKMRPTRSISSGVGWSVWMCSVCGSTTSVCLTDRTKLASGPGLFGTSRARLSENATSSPVNGVPSWNVTPSRSLTSQVSGSSSFHETARLGWMRSIESNSIMLSNMFSAVATSLPRSENCGSSEFCSVARPIVSSAARTDLAPGSGQVASHTPIAMSNCSHRIVRAPPMSNDCAWHCRRSQGMNPRQSPALVAMSAAGEPASNCHRRYDGIRSRGRKFIEEGATVVVTGRSSRSVSDAQKALNANGIAIPPMSRSPLKSNSRFKQVRVAYGRTDVRYVRTGSVAKTTEEVFDEIVDAN